MLPFVPDDPNPPHVATHANLGFLGAITTAIAVPSPYGLLLLLIGFACPPSATYRPPSVDMATK